MIRCVAMYVCAVMSWGSSVCICMYAEECIECGHFALWGTGDGRDGRDMYVCGSFLSLSLSLYEFVVLQCMYVC
jgi:hypothetical protein